MIGAKTRLSTERVGSASKIGTMPRFRSSGDSQYGGNPGPGQYGSPSLTVESHQPCLPSVGFAKAGRDANKKVGVDASVVFLSALKRSLLVCWTGVRKAGLPFPWLMYVGTLSNLNTTAHHRYVLAGYGYDNTDLLLPCIVKHNAPPALLEAASPKPSGLGQNH